LSIKATEVGKAFRYATSFDMSGSTGLTLNFMAPDGTTLQKTEITTNAVTAPAVALINDPDLGDVAASEYMEFLTIATDFTVEGAWTVCGIYTDGTPKVFHGDSATFEVEAACS